ncbi:hypothetical protein [Deinococcus saxicola]|uniref:hypothetical protein n=1 Tax=Deinococcus saxicola TaxID=249406 RepID=UPI003D140484
MPQDASPSAAAPTTPVPSSALRRASCASSRAWSALSPQDSAYRASAKTPRRCSKRADLVMPAT